MIGSLISHLKRFGKREARPEDEVRIPPPAREPHPRVEYHDLKGRVQSLVWQGELVKLREGRAGRVIR